MSDRIRVVGSVGKIVRLEVDGKPLTITEHDALGLAAALLRTVFASDPEGLRMIAEALRSVQNRT